MTDQYEDIRVVCEDRVARISINRPTRMNAIRIKTYSELIHALRSADNSASCHIIVLQGESGQFTAGNDLADLVEAEPQQVMDGVQGIFETVAGLKKVLIAAVEGVAVGIGTTLLLHCDMVVASCEARFRLPFVNLGVCPEGASSVLLPLAIGEKNAREVLLTGRFFSSAEALAWGLINRVSEPGCAMEMAEEYITKLLQQPLPSLIATKQLLRAQTPDVRGVVAEELNAFAALLQSAETQARIKAIVAR